MFIRTDTIYLLCNLCDELCIALLCITERSFYSYPSFSTITDKSRILHPSSLFPSHLMIKSDAAHDLVPRNQPAAEEKLGLLDLLLVAGLLLLLQRTCSSPSR